MTKITVTEKVVQKLKNDTFEVGTGMKKLVILGMLFLLTLPSCSKHTGTTVTVVKPKYHHRFFNRKKDKRIKRIKTVKMRN